MCDDSKACEERREDLDAAFHVVDTDVLVRGVLVVVVVDDREADGGGPAAVHEEVHRNAAAEGWSAERRGAGTFADGMHDTGRERRLERRACGGIAGAPRQLHDA